MIYSITEDILWRGGGKLEVTRAIIEGKLEDVLPVPRSIWSYSGEDLGRLRKEFDALKKPVIIRPSTTRDLHFEVGAFNSKVAEYWNEFENFVRAAEEAYSGEETRRFCEEFGIKHDPRVHFLIQEHINCHNGAMVRNPHNKTLRLEYGVKGTLVGRLNRLRFFDSNNNPIEDKLEGDIRPAEEEARDLFVAFEKSGILPSTEWAVALEVGLNPKTFLQARLFKRYSPARDWKLPHVKSNAPHIEGIDCFGITPESGKVLTTFVDSIPIEVINSKQPYAVINTTRGGSVFIKEGGSMSLQGNPSLGNLQVFCGGADAGYWLNHNNYRLVKRAEIAETTSGRDVRYLKNEEAFNNRDVRFFCNGSRLLAIPE